MKNLYLVIAALLLSFMTAQAQLSITGEINARSEFRNGFKTPILESQTNAFFIEQRTRLYTSYKAEGLEVKLTVQDIRTWGANRQIYKEENNTFGIVDAWGKYNFNEGLFLKVGRQMISYDNERYFGGLEWAMQGRRHDALLLGYEKDGLKIHVGGAYNQAQTPFEYAKLVGNDYLGVANYKHMQYLWANKKWESAKASLYVVNNGYQRAAGDSTYSLQTVGLMAEKSLGKLKLNGEFFGQFGQINENVDKSAFMFSLSGTYKTDVTPITVGIDYLSGDDAETADKNEAFSPDFGTNHAFYGFMDYFYVGNGHKGGLQDIYLKTKFKLGGGALLVHVHQFLSAADVTDAAGNTASSSLGTELDLVYVKKLAPAVTWKLGYSHMLETDAMYAVKTPAGGGAFDVAGAGVGTNFWAWTQIIIKPKFL